MNKVIQRAFPLLVLFGVVAGIPLGSAFGQTERSGTSVKWEYRVLTQEKVAELGKNDVAAGLNILGEEGWQLVAVEAAFPSEKGSKAPAGAAQFYLKRSDLIPAPKQTNGSSTDQPAKK